MEGLNSFIVLASQVQPSWAPTATPGLAWPLLESSGLTEELGVRVQLSLPWAHTTLKQSVPLWSPVLGPLDRGSTDPQTGKETSLSPTLPYYFLPPAQSNLSQGNSKQTPPQLKILPQLPSVPGAKSKLLQALEAQQI